MKLRSLIFLAAVLALAGMVNPVRAEVNVPVAPELASAAVASEWMPMLPVRLKTANISQKLDQEPVIVILDDDRKDQCPTVNPCDTVPAPGDIEGWFWWAISCIF